MRKQLLLPFLGTACAVLLALSGCREDDALPPAGPANAAAFAGTTLSINPTVQFLTNGQVLYVNGQTTGTIFPVSTAQLSGTYTYSPSSDFSSGTMVLTLPAPASTITLDFKNFQQSNGNVTSFNVGYNGQNVSGTVSNGTLTAYSRSGTTTVTAPPTTTPTTPTPPTTPTTPPSTGTSTALSKALEFGSASAGAPYTNGQRVTFTLNRDSTDATKNTLQFSGKTLSNPTVTNSSSTIQINTFADGSTRYETVIRDNALYEINVLVGTTFTGQFSEPTTSSNSGTSGGGTSGGGSLPGPFAAGTTFTRTISTVTVAPIGAAIPAGVPAFSVGQQVTFTVNSAGALSFNGATIPFSADAGSSVVYNEIPSTGNANTATVFKNLTTGAPTGGSLSYNRVTLTLPPSVVMVTYTFN